MQNETFRQIVSTTRYTLPATNKYSDTNRLFNTTNELLKVDTRDRVDNYYYEYATGAKTGYTTAAKDCIVATAKKDGVEYIVVILGAERTENGLSARYLDCKNLFNYAFENYTTYKVNDENSVLKQVSVSNGSIATKNLDVVIQDNIIFSLKKSTDVSTINPTVEISSDLTAPISKNTVIGKITYNVDGNEYSSNLLAGADVIESKAVTTFLTIISIILVLFFISKLIRSSNKKKKRKNKYSKNSKNKKSKLRNNNYYFY